MGDSASPKPERDDWTPPIGISRGGIESIAVSPAHGELSDDPVEQAEIAYGFRLRYGLIDENTYQAAMRYIGLIREANEQVVIVERDGEADLYMHDDEREPSLTLVSRPIFEGSETRLHYLIAQPDAKLDAEMLALIRENVNLQREWQEIAIAIANTLEAPRDIDPIMFPLHDTDDYEDNAGFSLAIEAHDARDAGHISDDEFETIRNALLFRDIFKRDIGQIFIHRSPDGKNWRVYEFPQTQTTDELGLDDE